MTPRPRLLFLSQRFLFPADTGGKIRTSRILEQLRRRYEIVLVGNEAPGQADAHRADLERICDVFVGVPRREVPRYSRRFYLRVARRTLSRYPISALNDYSPALERALHETIARRGPFDLLVCDFVQSALLFRRVRHPATLLFQHNVEATIAERHYRRARTVAERLFWRAQWKRMLRFERDASRRFTTVIAVSAEDRARFEQLYGLTHVAEIPTGVDTDEFQPTGRPPDPDLVAFCGSMDWLPNEEGVLWFAREVLPRIVRSRPAARLLVIGRNPSPRLAEAAAAPDSHLDLTGWVDDVRPALERASVVVVPLRIGGGTRMKIYEAMAMARPVVSTTLGAEGLPVKPGEHLFLEDTPDAFARRVLQLLERPSLGEAMGRAAREWVHAHFRWDRVGEVFAAICDETIRRGSL